MITFLQQLINGIAQGSAYALIALGYTMVYGVLRLINFAHSDVYMLGAFMGYYLANNRGIRSIFGDSSIGAVVVMVGAMAICALAGVVIERFAYRSGRSDSPSTLAFWLGILGFSAGGVLSSSLPSLIIGAVTGVILGVILQKLGLRPVRQESRLGLLIIAIGVSL